jgi:phosphate butyryltransferase
MVRSLRDIAKLAQKCGPKKLAVLAPEDEEFMLAVKRSCEMGYIEPILIGNTKKMERLAKNIKFDISGFEKIVENDRQTISDLGINLLFSGKLSIVSKGQIPTSYIYRSTIRAEAKAGSGMKVSVISLWEMPEVDHLVAITDTGVTINPDFKTKVEILKNAVFLYHLFGYKKPQIAVLSAQREFSETLSSYHDYESLKQVAASGDMGECEIIDSTSLSEIFMGMGGHLNNYSEIDLMKTPHIFLVPCLDTGNILCKLDLLLGVKRCSLTVTSRGAVCIPARSDLRDAIITQIAMGVVVADRIGKSVS